MVGAQGEELSNHVHQDEVDLLALSTHETMLGMVWRIVCKRAHVPVQRLPFADVFHKNVNIHAIPSLRGSVVAAHRL